MSCVRVCRVTSNHLYILHFSIFSIFRILIVFVLELKNDFFSYILSNKKKIMITINFIRFL